MIEKERRYAYGKHDGHKEEKEYVKTARLKLLQLRPKFNEVLERCSSDVDAGESRVAQKKYEELVVVMANTVVNPRTVVVHFEHACLTHATVMGSIGLDAFAFLTEAHTATIRTIE